MGDILHTAMYLCTKQKSDWTSVSKNDITVCIVWFTSTRQSCFRGKRYICVVDVCCLKPVLLKTCQLTEVNKRNGQLTHTPKEDFSKNYTQEISWSGL